MSTVEPTAYYILCRTRTVLSRKPYRDWREIQDEFDDYMASVGPSTETEWAKYFEWDYGPDDARWPFSRAAIAALFRGTCERIEVEESTEAPGD